MNISSVAFNFACLIESTEFFVAKYLVLQTMAARGHMNGWTAVGGTGWSAQRGSLHHQIFGDGIKSRESILIPGLDLDVVDAGGAEGADEGGGEAGVGEEGDVEVNGRSSDLVTVGQLKF